MPYCFSCGKLRVTYGGFCAQCKADEQKRLEPERKAKEAKKRRESQGKRRP